MVSDRLGSRDRPTAVQTDGGDAGSDEGLRSAGGATADGRRSLVLTAARLPTQDVPGGNLRGTVTRTRLRRRRQNSGARPSRRATAYRRLSSRGTSSSASWPLSGPAATVDQRSAQRRLLVQVLRGCGGSDRHRHERAYVFSRCRSRASRVASIDGSLGLHPENRSVESSVHSTGYCTASAT